MIDFDRLFFLLPEGNRGTLVVKPAEPLLVDPFRLFWGEVCPSQPIRLVHHIGSRATDFLQSSFPPLSAISATFVSVMRESGFTGFGSFAVEVSGKQGVSLPDYTGLSILSRCGPIENSRSKMIKRPPAIPGKATEITTWLGLYFDPTTWDGSDIFVPQGSARIFLTEKVKDALESARLTNLRFERITEVERLVLT